MVQKVGMTYDLGPRARRVYAALRDRVRRDVWPPGTKIPPHLELAAEFGVAPMTVRQVLARLEDEGLLSRQVGRGTFVLPPSGPTILLAHPEEAMRAILSEHLAAIGRRAVVAASSIDALALLRGDPSVTLIVTALRLPTLTVGTAFVRAVRDRHADLPIAVVASDLGDLRELFDSPEWPLLVLPEPVRLGHLDQIVRLVLDRPRRERG
jgi:DNA-binding transcriptional regulator YhcF (GntR family)